MGQWLPVIPATFEAGADPDNHRWFGVDLLGRNPAAVPVIQVLPNQRRMATKKACGGLPHASEIVSGIDDQLPDCSDVGDVGWPGWDVPVRKLSICDCFCSFSNATYMAARIF